MPSAVRSESRAGRENGETSSTKKLKRDHHSRVKEEMETPPVTPSQVSSDQLEKTQELDVTMMDTEQWVDTGEDLLLETANGHSADYDAPLMSPIFDDNNNNGNKKSKRRRRASNLSTDSSAEQNNGLNSSMTNGNLSSSADLDSGKRAGNGRKRKQTMTPPLTFEDTDEDDTLNDDDDFLAPPTPPSKKKRRGGHGSEVGSTKPKPASRLRTRTRRRVSEEEGATTSCSGILKSIKMYNFMCHKGFFQEWHPNLNFITGENGSGKSALLTGLLIGLGAKATLTSRTRSTTSLIQKGKDSARTEITLLNNGALPYEKYGDEVMIERTLSKNGSSTYRLKTHGTFHKLKRHELDFILLSLNIQLDNPVAILNQEVAKNFLRTKDPKDKYKLFYQGTLLSKLFELMSDSKNAIEVSRKNLMCQKNMLYDLRTEIRELEAKLKEVANLSNIRMKNKELGIEYLWAVVKDEEKQKEKFHKDVEGHEEAIRKLVSNLDAAKEKKRTLLQEMDPGQDGTAEIKKKIKEKEAALEISRRELTDAQKVIQKCNAGLKLNRDTVRKRQRMLKDVSDMLEKIKSNTEADKERAIREYEENKTKLLAEKLKVNEELLSLKRDCEQFYNGVSSAGDHVNNMMDELRNYNNSYESKKRQLDALQSKGSNKYAIFGRNMEILMGKINSNIRKFSKPPRGPIGAHLTVKDPKFTGLAEHVLKSKNFLVTFMVNNSDDLLLLKKLIQESYNGARNDYGRPSISNAMPAIKVNTFSDRMYDLGRRASTSARSSEAPNLLDLLEVDENDCVIVNGLIDYVDAESTLMFENNQKAATTMKDPSKFAKNTKHGYTLEGYRFLPYPNYAAHFQNAQVARAQYLKSSAKAQIDDLKVALLELKEKINVLKPLLDNKRKEEAELKRRHGLMIAQQENKRQVLSRTERSLKENETKKYKEPDLASHEEEVHELRGQIEQVEQENQEHEQLIEATNRKLEALQNQKEELQFSMNKLQKHIDNSVTERQKKQEEIHSIERFVDRLDGKIADLRRAKEPTMENFEKSKSEYERKLQQAQEAGPQVQCKRSAMDVKREVEALRIRITAMEKHIGDAEKIKNDHHKKKTEFRVKTKEFQPIWRCFTMLKDLINSQVTFLFRKRMGITNGLTFMYEGLVHQRGYKGQMKIDHDTKELHYYICPDQSSSNRTNEAIGENDKQTKKSLIEYSLGLSGGERSFSTICFIISLWQVMECPFYMLDEFDVFMDAFNRKTSQQALITHAKNQPTRQFFLFSPLDLVEIPSQDEATVIRLQPARPDKKTSMSPDNESENVDPAPRSSPITNRKGPGPRPRRTSFTAMSEKNSSSSRSRR